MRVQIIQVPYDSGCRGVRMGRGPEHFIQNGAARMLQMQGHKVQVDCIEAEDPFQAEIATTFELYRLLAQRVRAATTQKSFPLVFSGNCNSCLGTLAGIDLAQIGIVWFDGHGDFNTPETTVSGFLDGMGIAMATGRCWRTMANRIPGFHPVTEENIVLVGAREFDPEEIESYKRSDITIVGAESVRQNGIRAALEPALATLLTRVQKIYLHIDLDVLDPQEAMANGFAPPDGLFVDHVEEAILMLKERFTICAGAIASYDPKYDGEGKTFRAGVKFMEIMVAID